MKQRMLNEVALEQLLYFILEQKLNSYLTQMTVLRKNGRQVGIMELTKQIFDEKGYAYLQKKKIRKFTRSCKHDENNKDLF